MSEVTIEQIARQCDVNPRTARRYIKQAGVVPVRFSGKMKRTPLFSPTTTDTVKAAVLAQKLETHGYTVTGGEPRIATMGQLRAERRRAQKGGRQ